MVERAMKILGGLDGVTGMERDLRDLEITNEEWDIINEVLLFLKSFSEDTNDMEKSLSNV